jgi:hypothetical protein
MFVFKKRRLMDNFDSLLYGYKSFINLLFIYLFLYKYRYPYSLK